MDKEDVVHVYIDYICTHVLHTIKYHSAIKRWKLAIYNMD